ncbi:SNW/SKI-interacting protein A [Phytophthora rubi]|uniref:SNW/SKI-interacting protein A n=1 Tax=Phytophthora rubi TaxID=129364 RepID=A0A6A3MAV4_9STRA|nr:SNW/SKI-interacting protein A [Phytophthora rubi]
MSALFPAPVRSYTTFSDAAPASSAPASSQLASTSHIPRYPLRVTQQFVPRRNEDFGDGGAYPELPVAQFPLGMGKKGGNGSSSKNNGGGTLALQVRGEDGKVSYDAIVTQQHRDKTKVYTKFSDIVEKDGDAKALALPSRDEELEAATRTREALQLLVQGKVASALPTNVTRQKSAQETAKYVRYTPNEPGARQRVIRMVDVAKDPMEPPKFQHTKAVRGPPSPPVPVLHSPPRKLTVADQQSWKIPPCISNWKNSKGFTIALDKRLAADGRGLQQVTVNDNFASLSEALAIAERKAREEVNMRAQVQKKLAMKQKETKENELRELASKARMERAGIREDDEDRNSRRRRSASAQSDRGRRYSDEEDEDSDAEGRRERDRIRRERKKEREREMRMEKLGKKGKLARDEDRDVSEKIALGQLQGGGRAGGSDGMFDSRLFNQSQGISSGFGQEDEYNVYSKPMVDRGKASVYRPKGDDGAFDAEKEYEELKGGHSKRFKADKQFRGTEAVARGGGRDGPVQFSADNVKDEDDEDANKARAPDSRRDDARRSPSASPPQAREKIRSPQRSPPRRGRSPSGSPPRSRGRGRSPSNSPPRSRGRGRSPSGSPPRSRARGRSPSGSPLRSRARGRSPSPFRGRDRSAPRGRKRSPSRSPSYSRERGRPRARSRSPSYSRGRSSRRRSPSYSRSRRSPSRSRSRSRGADRKRRRRSPSEDSEDDPFGLDQFLTDARKEREASVDPHWQVNPVNLQDGYSRFKEKI